MSRGRVVILGGAGFIGSHLVEDLMEAGYPVRVFDKSNCDWSNLSGVRDRIEIEEGDFINRVDVARALKDCRVAVHLVSSTLPSTSNENPEYDVEANVLASLRFLNEAREARVGRVLFISSGGTIYGRSSRIPIPEEAPTEPLCSYGIGKLAVEKYLGLYRHLFGLDYTVLRFSNPYGERQNPAGAQGAVAVFLGRALAGQPVEIWGDGEVVRDYVYVKDAVRAFRLVLEKTPAETVFNVGSGRGVSLNQLVREIESATGVSLGVVRKPARPLDVPVNVLDSTRIERAVGWKPLVGLAEGLRRTWSWMRESPH